MKDTATGLIPFLAILNPFALCLYLTAVMDDLESGAFLRVLLRALVGEPLLVGVLDLRTEPLRIFGANQVLPIRCRRDLTAACGC